MRFRRRWFSAALLSALSASFGAVGCGSGGSGGGDPPAAIPEPVISTAVLPAARPAVFYTATIDASGGVAPYQWTLNAGIVLPAGLSFSSAGVLSGTAAATAVATVGVTVSDSQAPAKTATATFTLNVTNLQASIGLTHFGDAWTAESYPLSSIGGIGGVTFTLPVNGAGSSISSANPVAGTATYVAGASSGTVQIHAQDGTGQFIDINLFVQPNPIVNRTAKFSTTDVWFLRFSGKFDSTHPFAADFDNALAKLGFRSPASTGATGTTADELAKLYIHQQVLRFVSVNYHNNADGSAAAGGFKISFPFVEPDAPHVKPADGAIVNPAINQYNVINMSAGENTSVIGRAWVDQTNNDSQENDTSVLPLVAGQSLGVFVDDIAEFVNTAYANNTLPNSPVGAGDVAALKALLYGTASPGGRFTLMKTIGEGYGKEVGATASHEIGHSVGLNHTTPSVGGSIMNASSTIGPGSSYSFVASDVTILTAGLPGPGRGGSPQTANSYRIAAPDEGYPADVLNHEMCECRVLNPRPVRLRTSIPAAR